MSDIKQQVIEVLKDIYDPEIPVSIWELGLVYDVSVTEENSVYIQMTLTTPACPVAGEMPGQIEQRVQELEAVEEVKVELVWDPPWTQDMMSEAAKLELGFL